MSFLGCTADCKDISSVKKGHTIFHLKFTILLRYCHLAYIQVHFVPAPCRMVNLRRKIPSDPKSLGIITFSR